MEKDCHRPMSVVVLRQKENRTVADVYNGTGKRVGVISEPRFLTTEECHVAARAFLNAHPELFPASVTNGQ